MTDVLALSKIKQLLLVALDSGSTEGERINALSCIQRKMNPHDLVRRLVSKEEMQQVFDKGVEKGRNEEVENARRNAVTIEAPFADSDVGLGVGPYSWIQIARHCERNTHRLNDWERSFVASIVRQLLYKPLNGNQANKLHQIFHQRFGERI